MTELLAVPPTQGQLLHLKETLKRIKEGHHLLDQKREVLLQKLMDRVQEAEAMEEKARKLLASGQKALNHALIHMGEDRIQWISLAPGVETQVNIRLESIMGVEIPVIEMDIQQESFPYAPGNTSPAVDLARKKWMDILASLGKVAESTTTVWRLAQALRKTQRRVNALEDIVIPRYQATISWIEDVLSEEERESIVRAKRVKAMRHGSP